MKNVRHDLDPLLVSKQTAEKIAAYERDRITLRARSDKTIAEYKQAKTAWHRPSDGAHINPMIDAWIEREINYYSKVRVIERADGFRLVYGEADDATVKDGSGPYPTLNEAVAWYLRGGR